MNDTGEVFCKDILAGELKRDSDGYVFSYNKDYFNNHEMPSVSLTIPKTKRIHHSEILFPFFFGLLSEGSNKEMQCRVLKLDEKNYFTRLLRTAHTDTIGGITVKLKGI
jgi:HipA-like protein